MQWGLIMFLKSVIWMSLDHTIVYLCACFTNDINKAELGIMEQIQIYIRVKQLYVFTHLTVAVSLNCFQSNEYLHPTQSCWSRYICMT